MIQNVKTYGKRNVFAAAAIAAIAVLCALIAGVMVSVNAETDKHVVANGSATVLTAEYGVGAQFELPAAAAIEYGSKQYDASVILRGPNGNGFNSQKVTLGVAGKWTLEYRATADDGNALTAEESFYCRDKLFSVSSPRSSAEYVAEKQLHNGIKGGAGIDISVAKGDSFGYNKVIDLSGKTRNDKIVTFYMAPETLYNYDASQINFVFTDAYDRDNSVTVTVKRTLQYSISDMQKYSYVTANAAGQPATGINQPVQAQYPSVTVDGETYSLHVGNAYGRAVPHSMYGGCELDDSAANFLGKTMSIAYESETKRVYAYGTDGSARLVADLDDPAQFENPWGGFTDGKVLLSVNMGSYRALNANAVITNINGGELSAEYSRDDFGPSVTVDLDGYDESNLPKARVGSPYPLFDSYAIDESNGRVICDVSVWRNYFSESTRARISSDGKTFTPTRPGIYTVLYSAKDYEGNVTSKTYNITAEQLPALTLSHDDCAVSSAVGKPFTVSGVSLEGGAGVKAVSAKAALDSDSSVEYELTSDGDGNYSFVPLAQGAYTVTFAYSDYLESKTEEIKFNATSATGAYIPAEAAVPRYVLSGATYALPELNGYVFEGGATVKACTAAVTGGELAANGKSFRVTAESGNIKLTYTLAMQGGESAVKEYEIPVVAGTGVDGAERSLNMLALFTQSVCPFEQSGSVRKDVAMRLTQNDFEGRPVFTVTNGDSTAAYGSVDFANKLLASSFATRFSIEQPDFDRVSVYITDSVNASQTVRVTFENAGSWKMNFRVNNGYTYSTSYTATSSVDIAYDAAHGTIETGSIAATVSEYLGGGEFKGFESGYVYVTYQLEGVHAASTAAIRVYAVNNQTISGNKIDVVDPEVTAYAGQGDLAVNTVTEIPAFLVCDVINPFSSVSVKVTAPSGAVMVSEDGISLDGTQDISRSYKIKLTEYGNYTIAVTGTVGKNNTEFGTQYGIQVLDMSAPTVTFINPVTEAKVGDTVAFAGVNVSDDKTSADKITVTAYLVAPSGKITNVDIKTYGSFVAAEAGEYKFVIYACDEGNRYGSAVVPNTAIEWYTITVTA
ncbi:MAG: carboxypeptidase regulatory-like domain-containing protein [Clostridia bacterium]|nr:carboxypeptidase regulatory-like domain-containing protein [Clostridia bacterium]